MDMRSRNQYLKLLQRRYIGASKEEKGRILDEYCENTGQHRKYVIRKIRAPIMIDGRPRRQRSRVYDGDVVVALATLWKIFDHPCGQRLAPLLTQEMLDRLQDLGELRITNEVAQKLIGISPATIDRRLKREKEVVGQLRRKGITKPGSLLYQKIPVRLNDWDTSVIGNLGIDFVEHCGTSKGGHYACSLCVTDISSGWWEAEAVMGRGQARTLDALEMIRERTPFRWLEIHPDNDTVFINDHLLRYCQAEKIRFSRSRPYRKNDNCYVEQKNWTHIKKVFGYLRYDTTKELNIINDLYNNELRLFKNFFQPVMKLKQKSRVGGKVHRKYDVAKTPYQRLIESEQINRKTKKELKATYRSLNPAELNRNIKEKLDQLYKLYHSKKRSQNAKPFKKQTARNSVTF
jgi:hypothetical protein